MSQPELPSPITRDERALLDIARFELDPLKGRLVAPITKGPLFAVVCLGLLGSVAPLWILWRRVLGLIEGVLGGRR